jgi:CheY-like chemotaxis protein
MHPESTIAGENGVNILTGKRILVVEDEVLVAMLLEDMVTQLGADLAGSVSNLEDGLAFVDDQDFDAAILDMNLGDHDSRPIADKLQSRGIPYLLATGYGESAGNPHGVTILEKPYVIEQIEFALQSLWA